MKLVKKSKIKLISTTFLIVLLSACTTSVAQIHESSLSSILKNIHGQIPDSMFMNNLTNMTLTINQDSLINADVFLNIKNNTLDTIKVCTLFHMASPWELRSLLPCYSDSVRDHEQNNWNLSDSLYCNISYTFNNSANDIKNFGDEKTGFYLLPPDSTIKLPFNNLKRGYNVFFRIRSIIVINKRIGYIIKETNSIFLKQKSKVRDKSSD